MKNVSVNFPERKFESRLLTQLLLPPFLRRTAYVPPDRTAYPSGIKKVNLVINEGDRLAVLGVNGSGKTTLLKTISGIFEPTHGSIQRNGVIAPLVDLGLGISPEYSGLENIYLRGRLLGLSKSQLDVRLPEIIQFSELGAAIQQPVRTYSAGMLLRLSFSISVMVAPDVLVLDEWMSVGDFKFKTKAQERLHSLIDRTKILVLATHDLQLVEELANRCVIMEAGQVKYDGEVQAAIDIYSGN